MKHRKFIRFLVRDAAKSGVIFESRNIEDRNVLEVYYELYRFGFSTRVSSEELWRVYASKQRKRYLKLSSRPDFSYSKNFTPCYVCSSPVEKDTHYKQEGGLFPSSFPIPYNWCGKLLVPHSYCHEIFNIRIMCRRCSPDIFSVSLYECALTLGYDETNSLAALEKIDSLESSVIIYFSSYHKKGLCPNIDKMAR